MDGDHTDPPVPRQPGLLARALAVGVAILTAATLLFAGAGKIVSGYKAQVAYNADLNLVQAERLDLQQAIDDQQWLIPPGPDGSGGLLLDFGYALGEFAIAAGVLLFCRRRFVWPLNALLFGGLMGYAIQRYFAGEPCGCFGALWQPPEGFSVVIDAILLALSLAVMAAFGVRRAGLVATLVLSLAMAGVGHVYADRTEPLTHGDEPRAETAAPADPAPEPEATAADDPDHAPDLAPAEGNPAQRVLALDRMGDVATATAADPHYYVFVWDPACDICAALKPVVDAEGQDLEDVQDPMLRVRSLEKKVLKREHGIEDYLWPESPTVFVVHAGEVVSAFGGEETLFPSDVSEMLYNGEDLPDPTGFWDP